MPTVDYRLFTRGSTRTLTDTDGYKPRGQLQDIVSLPDGGSIGLFESSDSTGYPDFEHVPGSDRLTLQRFGADGRAVGPAMDLSADTEGWQRDPRIAVLPGGDLLALWEVRADETGGEDGIELRRFTPDLQPVGDVVRPFAGVLDMPRAGEIVVDAASGDIVVVARDAAGTDGVTAYARLDSGDLSVTARGATDLPYDGDAVAGALGADGTLMLLSETTDGMAVWPSDEVLPDQGNRAYNPELRALPGGGYVAGFIDVNDDGYENARIVFLDAEGRAQGDGTLLARSDPNQVYQLPDHATRDLNIDVLPSGHVVVVHLASFRLTEGDVPVINVFSPDGERLLRDLTLGDVGTYFDVTVDVSGGAPTISFYDAESRMVVAQTIDLVRETVAGDGGEKLVGDALADDMIGGAGQDTVLAGGGDDFVWTGAGADHVAAGDGADYVEGGDDDDVLIGEAGDDILFGGAGDDILIGDGGAAI